MEQRSMNVPALTIGLDLGDKESYMFALCFDGEILFDEPIPSTPEAFEYYFSRLPKARVVLEVGSLSRWASETLEKLGHQVVVANPRRASVLLTAAKRKGDRQDAQGLAMIGRSSPELLAPIKHRGREAHMDLCVVRARDGLVRARSQLVNLARSLVKATGRRLPPCSTPAFSRKAREAVPKELEPAILPLLDQIESLSLQIKRLDKKLEQLCEKYGETKRLRQLSGVGPLTALAYILTIEDPRRFQKSRTVGAFLGLAPALWASGESSPELRISKRGDDYLRRLLVSAAQYILGPFGSDSDLKRHGRRIAERGGKNAKKRAVVAVARKLAVLLHKLWISDEPYEPLRNSKAQVAA